MCQSERPRELSYWTRARAMVCVDGQKDIPVEYNDSIHISKKNSSLKIIHPSNNDFYEVVKN